MTFTSKLENELTSSELDKQKVIKKLVVEKNTKNFLKICHNPFKGVYYGQQ